MNPFALMAEMPTLATLLVFIFSTIFGSFLNVLIWRLPREEAITGRSHCPHCNHDLAWYDLVPLLSYLSTLGRCRYCGKPVSVRYPAIELITGALFALAVIIFPPTDLVSWLVLAKAFFIILVCITVFVIDLEHYLILDKVILPAIAGMLVLLIALDWTGHTTHYLIYGVSAALAAFIPFWLLWRLSRGRWMGFGDVKFMIFLGLALGLTGTLVALFLAFILGAVIGIGLMIIGKKQLSSKLPFGTFLTTAMLISLFFGTQLWQAYWRAFVV